VAAQVQAVTGQHVTLGSVDQGYTRADPAQAAAAHGMHRDVVKHTEAKRGFVLLPRCWVVERSFAWAARFRRLARNYEHLAHTLAGLALPRVCLSHAAARPRRDGGRNFIAGSRTVASESAPVTTQAGYPSS